MYFRGGLSIQSSACGTRPLPSRVSQNRHGALTLEFILTLPLLAIVLLALIEFALVLQLNQKVAFASRYGAKLAAEISRDLNESPNLGNFNSGSPEAQLKALIDEHLIRQGVTASCAVFLEHNACGVANSNQNSPPHHPISNPAALPPDCHCEAPQTPDMPGMPAPEDVAYVRVTVAVSLQGNVPNLLSTFGFDLSDSTLQQTSTMRVETNNTPPDSQSVGTLGSYSGSHTYLSGDSFPLSCDASIVIANPPGTPTAGGAVVTINFDASNSSDAEQGTDGLTYSWTAEIISNNGPGATVSPASGLLQTFNLQLGIPVDPDDDPDTTQPDNTAVYLVTLTVTDSCGQSSTCETHVEIRTRDSDPG